MSRTAQQSATATTSSTKRSKSARTAAATAPTRSTASTVTRPATTRAGTVTKTKSPPAATAAKPPATRGAARPATKPAANITTVELDAATTAAASGARRATRAAAVRTIGKSTPAAAAAVRAAKAPPKPLPLSQRPIDQVWREFRSTPTDEVRNFLISRHLELVAYAAERLHKRLPSEVEINDLKSAGAFGLMDAVDAFDPERGVKFETFCTQRIRGAMFDELRAMDWVPRLVRSRTAKVEKVRKSIEMETGRRATEDEVAERLNVSGDEFEKLQKDSRPVSMVSLTRKAFDSDSSKDVREIDVVEDGRQENPMQAVQKQDLQALITKGLSRAERLIVILYYYEEMTMKEIGATLDLSESRVSQMHSSILQRLKAQMQHRETTEE